MFNLEPIAAWVRLEAFVFPLPCLTSFVFMMNFICSFCPLVTRSALSERPCPCCSEQFVGSEHCHLASLFPPSVVGRSADAVGAVAVWYHEV